MFFIPEDYYEVRKTKGKGRGIFARKEIAPGTVLGDYMGVIQKDDEVDEGADLYAMSYSRNYVIIPEYKSVGLHVLNHSCTSNCFMRTLYGHTLYFALRRIFPGEEMTVPYLLGPPDEETCDPCHHACLCGSPVCTGTWHLSDEKHQRWSDYENDIAEKYPPKRVKPGQPLPKLDKYPKTISDNPVFDLFGYDNIEPAVYDDETLPKVPELRKRIRETGRRLDFPKFHQTVYGILNGLVVSKDY